MLLLLLLIQALVRPKVFDDDLRKRCKYLGHLPEGANVVFVEADLQSVVSDEGLKGFEQALRIRRSKRREKARKDEKARIRAEEREKEKLNAQRSELDSRLTLPPFKVPRTY